MKKDKDNALAAAAIAAMAIIAAGAVAAIIAEGWLLAAVPLAVLMLPWIAEAFKDGADF